MTPTQTMEARVETRETDQGAMDCDPEFLRGLMRGLNDRRLGRMVPWAQVKKEFGLR